MNWYIWDTGLTEVMRKADAAEEKKAKCEAVLERLDEPDWEIWTDGSVKDEE